MRAPEECRYFSIGLNMFIFLRNASLSCPGHVKNYTKGIFCLIQPDLQEQQRIFKIYKTLNEEILSLRSDLVATSQVMLQHEQIFLYATRAAV